MSRRTIIIWGTVGLVVIALIAFFYLSSNQTPPAREAINLGDPNVIAISQGTEGDVHALEIGVSYVGVDNSASIAIFDLDRPDNGNIEENIVVGSSIPLDGYFILVLDIDGSNETVTLEVLPTE